MILWNVQPALVALLLVLKQKKSGTKDKILSNSKLVAKFSFPEGKKSELFFSEMVVAVLKYSHWEAVI